MHITSTVLLVKSEGQESDPRDKHAALLVSALYELHLHWTALYLSIYMRFIHIILPSGKYSFRLVDLFKVEGSLLHFLRHERLFYPS
jgi:hypothetical protein